LVISIIHDHRTNIIHCISQYKICSFSPRRRYLRVVELILLTGVFASICFLLPLLSTTFCTKVPETTGDFTEQENDLFSELVQVRQSFLYYFLFFYSLYPLYPLFYIDFVVYLHLCLSFFVVMVAAVWILLYLNLTGTNIFPLSCHVMSYPVLLHPLYKQTFTYIFLFIYHRQRRCCCCWYSSNVQMDSTTN